MLNRKFLPRSSILWLFFSFLSSFWLIINIPYHIFSNFTPPNLYHEYSYEEFKHILLKNHKFHHNLLNKGFFEGNYWKFALLPKVYRVSSKNILELLVSNSSKKLSFKSSIPSVSSVISPKTFLPKSSFQCFYIQSTYLNFDPNHKKYFIL